MSRWASPSYGSRRLAVWRANLRDRLAGAHARANARMGYLRPPLGQGRVLWIKAGGSRESVLLAAELLGAIRGKRLDLRLALTFEEDYADIIEPRVRGMRKIGLGYGPCDLPRVARRTLRRLDPMGLLVVGAPPPERLLQAAARAGTHLVAVDCPPADTPVEAAYPADAAQAGAWAARGTAAHVAPAADLLSLLVEAQVDTTLRSLVCGPRELHLWWWQGPASGLQAFVAAWRRSALAEGVLFVSPPGPATLAPAPGLMPISAWRREPLAPGTVVLVDDPRWRPAVASAAAGAHLEASDRRGLWEALAGGCALTGSADLVATHPRLEAAVSVCADPAQVLAAWEEDRDSPLAARRRGDACRRLLWEERRRAQTVLEALLQRVFDW